MPAPIRSKRPQRRPSTLAGREAAQRGENSQRREAEEERALRDALREAREAERMACGGRVKKMAKGGSCRGMGKATRGGGYSRMG